MDKIKEQSKELDILNKLNVAAQLLSEISIHTKIAPEELTSNSSMLIALVKRFNTQNS